MKRQHRSICDNFAKKPDHFTPSKFRRCSVKTTNDIHVYQNISKIQDHTLHRCVSETFSGSRCCPVSLADSAAKVCAFVLPFQVVEERCHPVPVPVMQKLLFWSFPRNENDIRRYSSMTYGMISKSICKTPSMIITSPNNHLVHEETSSNSIELEKKVCSFKQGVAIVETGKVKNVLQIGFHISGEVGNDKEDAISKRYHVSMSFDRCKITSVNCDCNENDMFFCPHVVALAIFRIRKPQMVSIRSPISDTLQQLDRDQLQKLTQYLLSQHKQILPTAQTLAELLTDSKSTLNVVKGAPDPTAGAGTDDANEWALDEGDIKSHLSKILQSHSQDIVAKVHVLLAKVTDMLRSRDSNGCCLLKLITEKLVQHFFSCTTAVTDTGRPYSQHWKDVWDKIERLWVCVVLKPKQSSEKLQEIVLFLKDWNSRIHSADSLRESFRSDFVQLPTNNQSTLFSFAINAAEINWDDKNLQNIIHTSPVYNDTYNEENQPQWNESTTISVARVEALVCHGLVKEAKNLACAIARSIIHRQMKKSTSYQNENCSTGEDSNHPTTPEIYKHPFRLIEVLFDVLVNTENTEDEKATPYGCLAFEVTLLSLTNRTCFTTDCYDQKRGLLAENALINRLRNFQLDEDMIRILKNVGHYLLAEESRYYTKDQIATNTTKENYAPFYNFGSYLFQNILPHDRQLAFRIGKLALRSSQNHAVPYNQSGDFVGTNVHDTNRTNLPTRPYQIMGKYDIQNQFEADMCELATFLIKTAKEDAGELCEVVESTLQNIKNPNHLLQLSRVAYMTAIQVTGSQNIPMFNVALRLCKQALQLTIHSNLWPRQEMIGWLVPCAAEIGLNAIVSIVKDWYNLFTPAEATSMVANCVISPNTAMRLNLDPTQRDDLHKSVCQMAMECTVKDPQSSALRCLKLCEQRSSIFDATYGVIIDAAAKNHMKPSQLYNIARYLHQSGLTDRAFSVAFAATRCLSIGYNHETHPATSDLMWTMQLALGLGKPELMQMVNIVCCNVKCAAVLSEVLQICTSGVNSSDSKNLDSAAILFNKPKHEIYRDLIYSNGNAHYGERRLRAQSPILQPLVEAAMTAYTNTILAKLSNISPRHYIEFIHFFKQAQETFLLSPNGYSRLEELKTGLKTLYKGKKKLLNLISLHFG